MGLVKVFNHSFINGDCMVDIALLEIKTLK